MTERGRHKVAMRPGRRHVLSMVPFLPIPQNEDGTGGGIVLRVYGDGYEPELVRVEWGEQTIIEILAFEDAS